jgi:acetyltransferase-like isoleucine patch superfamily enzyme
MSRWSDLINGYEDLFDDKDPWDIDVLDFVKNRSNDSIFIHPTSTVEEGVILKGPVYIGPDCFVGAHAYLRGGVFLMGNNSVGPGCELKTCVLFQNTNLAHFNFVGDSILGSNVNMEAGSIIANHYNERTDKEIFPGVTKFGAVVGDGSKIGANAVLSPGTILEKNSIIARQALISKNNMGLAYRQAGFNWRELFVNKAFDLVMLIVGLTIAFQLENWRSGSEQQSKETFYKENLLSDVNSDIMEMTQIMKDLKNDRTAVELYLPLMEKLPPDSLLTPLMAIMSLETFSPSDNTYTTLIASTGLNAFNDRDLVDKLTEYYASYTSIRRFESVYTAALFEIHRHFSEHVIYDQRKVVNKNVTLMPQSRNSFIVADGQLNTGLEDYEDALNRALALKMALEKSL